MVNEHQYIIEQMTRDSVDEALRYFNLGKRSTQTCFVAGVVRLSFHSTVKVTLTRGRRASEEFEWLKSGITYEWESPDTALIEIPVSFVEIFGIGGFVLDDESIERHRGYVELWNAPHQPAPTRRKLPERFGSVRI